MRGVAPDGVSSCESVTGGDGSAVLYVQVERFQAQLKSDSLISHHLDLLYERMLENNLMKIVFPYR